MNERLNWMFPSLYVRRVFSTDVRVSWWFVLVPLIVYPRHGLELTLAFTGLLFLSVLLHEFAHVFVARWTGGVADEIQLSPVGGIAPIRPGQGAFAIALTAAAGPLLNLFVCLCLFPAWYAPQALWNCLNPFVMPVDRLHAENLWRDFALILFLVNWMLLLINLLPVTPLDGGHILRSVLSTNIHPELVNRTALQIGLVVSIMFLITGAIVDMSQIVLIGTFILMTNVVQLLQEELGEAMDDSGFGYDFSASYESVEATNPTATRQVSMSLLQRWRESRRLRREQLERIRRMEAEQQLDFLLAKVHETGLQSLSEEEQKRLRSCSELLRTRPKDEG
jgi:stage IV sporulation protein FB